MPSFLELARAIARHDARVTRRLRADAACARMTLASGATRATASDYFLEDMQHYVYAGDTLLHVAAASYSTGVARLLVKLGADVRARNRRGAEPLHYAADGSPTLSTWNPRAQAATIAFLIEAGADANALDKSGVAPLHRAVRTRGADAVRALLEGGADPDLRNANGSTALDLASRTTGRGGSGSAESKREQQRIVRLLTIR